MITLKPTGKSRKSQDPALLECENEKPCGRWVLHVYDGSQDDGHEYYSCDKCGQVRKWG